MSKSKEERKVISQLIMGEMPFSSNGFSTIKITKNGEEEFVDIPIRSVGMGELKNKTQQKRPRPPVVRNLVKRNSSEGKELGLRHDMFVNVLDFANEEYQKKLEEYEEKSIWRTIAFGINMIIKNENGEIIEDLDKKADALKKTGLTQEQAMKIFDDIIGLTKDFEEEQDFLSDLL